MGISRRYQEEYLRLLALGTIGYALYCRTPSLICTSPLIFAKIPEQRTGNDRLFCSFPATLGNQRSSDQQGASSMQPIARPLRSENGQAVLDQNRRRLLQYEKILPAAIRTNPCDQRSLATGPLSGVCPGHARSATIEHHAYPDEPATPVCSEQKNAVPPTLSCQSWHMYSQRSDSRAGKRPSG